MINQLTSKHKDIIFTEGETFWWSPEDQQVYYDPKRLDTPEGKASLLHEVAHATLGHETYDHDIDLLKYELDAWEKAKSMSSDYAVIIDQDYVEDCLDSYRDWLKKRSTCPDCSYVNFQTSHAVYDCFNCGCSWKVPASAICRISRIKITAS